MLMDFALVGSKADSTAVEKAEWMATQLADLTVKHLVEQSADK
jgi:hypothetical protein